jgi:hypothetical protein
MVVPTNTTVVLKVVSQDVVHSWWIPQLGGKVQAVPGYTNYTWFKISKPGNYKGQCSFLCGRGHARMIAEVTAVSPAQYKRWLQQQNLTADTKAEKCRKELAQGAGVRSGASSRTHCGVTREDSMATAALPRPPDRRPSRRARAARPDELADDDRPQADRDPLPRHVVRLLHPRRHRGADDPPAARRGEQHAGHPEVYNQLFTMHGTTMIFLFVVPMMAGFGNYFVPLMIGARDMAFPRLNALSYWLFLAGGIVLYASIFWSPPEAGWISTVPLATSTYLPPAASTRGST